MRNLNRNKQQMFYSLQNGRKPIYETDEEGNIIYFEDSEGNRYPSETGEYEIKYEMPVEFWANISSTLASAAFKPFGIDNSSNKAVISCEKGLLPIKEGSLIWRKSEIEYKPDGSVDSASADYQVKGVAIEGLNSDLYLLERL